MKILVFALLLAGLIILARLLSRKFKPVVSPQTPYSPRLRSSTPTPPRGLFKRALEHGGASIDTGNHLGLMIARAEHIRYCPPGWVFLSLEDAKSPAGLDLFYECLARAKEGRAAWPPKEDGTRSK